jgi:hypothetical protein
MTGTPVDAGYCHCRLCQRASGAPVVAWATFAAADFHLLAGDLTTYRSSVRGERGFCARCGTPIAFRYLSKPEYIDITVASLDDPAALPPQYHIWTMSQVPWLRVDDTLPRHMDGGRDLPA